MKLIKIGYIDIWKNLLSQKSKESIQKKKKKLNAMLSNVLPYQRILQNILINHEILKS